MVHAKICSAHFRCEDLVDPATKKRRRKKGAVPSIFAWTKDTNKREKIQDNLARGKVEKERLLEVDAQILRPKVLQSSMRPVYFRQADYFKVWIPWILLKRYYSLWNC